MANNLTSANSIIMLTVAGLYDSPQQLQEFAAEDIFDTAMVSNAEVVMGADGVMSYGYVFTTRVQTFHIQANSPSATIFDDWINAEEQARDKFTAGAVITLPGLGATWTLTNGVLSSFSMMPDAKKILQPRSFVITWNKMVGAPL
jgi:hypothetical protein